jgi:hypothetical protein
MAPPKRVRVPGSFRHRELPAGTVYVGRAIFGYPRSPFANPYPIPKAGRPPVAVEVDGETVEVRDRAHCLELYAAYLQRHPELVERARTELPGHDLACWCKEDEPCHGDLLLALARGADPG